MSTTDALTWILIIAVGVALAPIAIWIVAAWILWAIFIK